MSDLNELDLQVGEEILVITPEKGYSVEEQLDQEQNTKQIVNLSFYDNVDFLIRYNLGVGTQWRGRTDHQVLSARRGNTTLTTIKMSEMCTLGGCNGGSTTKEIKDLTSAQTVVVDYQVWSVRGYLNWYPVITVTADNVVVFDQSFHRNDANGNRLARTVSFNLQKLYR